MSSVEILNVLCEGSQYQQHEKMHNEFSKEKKNNNNNTTTQSGLYLHSIISYSNIHESGLTVDLYASGSS